MRTGPETQNPLRPESAGEGFVFGFSQTFAIERYANKTSSRSIKGCKASKSRLERSLRPLLSLLMMMSLLMLIRMLLVMVPIV